jgi:hypothetical protein
VATAVVRAWVPWVGAMGAVLLLFTDGAYLLLVGSEGDLGEPRVIVVAVMIAVAGLTVGLTPRVRHATLRSAFLWAATAFLFVLGYLSLFSIGALLLLGAILALATALAGDAAGSWMAKIAGGLLGAALPIAIILFTP